MTKHWRLIEQIAMHVAAVAAITFALLIASGFVHAHPRHSCHQHATTTHCH